MKWLDLTPTQEDDFALEVIRREAPKISKEQLVECTISLTRQLQIKDRVIRQLLKKEVHNEPRS
jgi:hypothetical protein